MKYVVADDSETTHAEVDKVPVNVKMKDPVELTDDQVKRLGDIGMTVQKVEGGRISSGTNQSPPPNPDA